MARLSRVEARDDGAVASEGINRERVCLGCTLEECEANWELGTRSWFKEFTLSLHALKVEIAR